MTEFAPIVPGILSPETPPYPPQQPPYTPQQPSTPSKGGVPSVTDEVPPTPTEENAPIDIPIITPVVDIVTNIVVVELPQARDRVIEFLRMIFDWIRDVFDRLNRAIESFMAGEGVRDAAFTAAVAGLVVTALFATLLFALIPAAGVAELLLFPYLFWQNLLTVLGIVPNVKPWGVVYDSVTHQPIALAHMSLINAYGAITATAITQNDGSFSAVVPDGSYTLRIDAQNRTLPLATTAPLLFDTIYTAEPILVRGNQPARPFDVAVQGAGVSASALTPMQSFLLSHEVSLTNTGFLIFGVGFLSSVLFLIFYPSALSLAVCALYVAVAVFRAVGVFGSYASVFLSKGTGLPLAGKLVTVVDAQTNTAVSKTLTSVFGRAYLSVPDGAYYTLVSDPSMPTGTAPSTMTAPFAARTGLFRKRFVL